MVEKTMDRKIADALEKQADLMKTPFIQNDITERLLEKTGGEGLYNKFTIDLSVAHTDEEYFFSGDRLTVEDVDDAVTIKLNSRKNDPIDLQKIPEIHAPITKFYVTNDAGSGDLKLLCGSKGMFEAKKKLEIVTNADYIIKKVGSHTVAIDGETGEVIKKSTTVLTVFDYIKGLGGHILVKAGTYEVLDNIEHTSANDNIWWDGDGIDRTIIKKATGGTGNAVLRFLGVTNFKVSNMTIDANGSVSGSTYSAIATNGCDRVTYENIYTKNGSRNNLSITNASHDVMLNNIWTSDAKEFHGISISTDTAACYNINMQNINAWDNAGWGIDIAGAYDVNLNNFNFVDNDDGIKIVGTSPEAKRINVSNGTISFTAAGAGIDVYSGKEINIDNVIINNADDAIYFRSPVSHSNINNVIMYAPTSDGIVLGGSGGVGANHINISNCTVDTPGGYGYKNAGDLVYDVNITNCTVNDASRGFYFYDGICTRINIIGCKVIDATAFGMVLRAITHFTVANCVISGSTTAGIKIANSDDPSDFTFIGNHVIDGAGKGIHVEDTGSTNFIIMGNNLLGNTGDNLDDDSIGATKVVDHNLV
jgi:Right handed beta helix region